MQNCLYYILVNIFSNFLDLYIDVEIFELNGIYIFMVFTCLSLILFLFISCIRETITDNTKNVELQTEVMLQEDLDTQKAEYTPTVNVQIVYVN